jgi:lauroyl/myristoyl acyltransferase
LLRAIAAGLGDLIFFAFPRRRRLILSNLHHAFPEKSPAWHRSIGRQSCRRMIETGLLSLATPFLSETRLRTIISAAPGLREVYTTHHAVPAAHRLLGSTDFDGADRPGAVSGIRHDLSPAG